MRLFYCKSKNSVKKIKILIILFAVCCTSCCKMEKRLENIKASTVFKVQWSANSGNYNAVASVISQGKRVFQQVNGSFRRDTVLADTIPMLRISRNARIKTKSLVGIGVNTFFMVESVQGVPQVQTREPVLGTGTDLEHAHLKRRHDSHRRFFRETEISLRSADSLARLYL